MKINYLCDCGKRNSIEMKRRPKGGKLPLYYCKSCGKPSYDVCPCGHLAPVGSDHQWCQSCGAPGEALRRGVPAVDIAKNFWSKIWEFVYCVAMVYAMKTYFAPWAAKQALARNSLPPTCALIIGIIGGLWLFCQIAPTFLVPLYTFLTGEKKAPLEMRAVTCYGCFDTVHLSLEEELTTKALRTRTRIKRVRTRIKLIVRKCWRKFPAGFRTWVNTK